MAAGPPADVLTMPPMLSTAPNAGVPAGLKRRAFDASEAKGHAAGVLFIAPDGDVLLCRRAGEEKNYGGYWALPGGGVEEDETPVEGATRECREEIGFDAGDLNWKVLDQRMTPTGMAFHTFAVPVDKKFKPTINDEHVGWSWVPLNQLPPPVHPGVQETLMDRLGIAADMTLEDWDGLRNGLLKWISEEESEGEHAEDGIPRRSAQDIATDSALRMALDRSVRSFDEDGRMRVKITNISKANVCPYLGREIPGWDEDSQVHLLGLDPDEKYMLLRDPEELAKSLPTWNGIQLLKDHKPVDADDHKKHDIVGTTGTDAEFDGVYLKNSLIFWTQEGIDLVESDEQRELSCGYHYDPDMTPGVFEGEHYDGVMRNIRGNHVALVEEGRAGPDVLVADSGRDMQWSLLAEILDTAWAGQ